jgi:hypothetical protein
MKKLCTASNKPAAAVCARCDLALVGSGILVE